MKRIGILFLILALALCGCGAQGDGWQAQYDQGVRYLSEGSYEEAVLAFTAAITIDPRRAEGHLGLANAHLALGDTAAAREVLLAALEQAEEDGDIRALLQTLEEGGDPGEDPGEAIPTPTAFSRRESYYPCESLTGAQQDLLRALMDAAVSGDFQPIAATGTEFPEGQRIYTEIDGFRLCVWQLILPQGRNECFELRAELRVENGTGYTYELTWHEGPDYQGGLYWQSVSIGSCPCVAWQWNGSCRTHTLLQQEESDLSLRGEYWSDGQMEDNWRVGEWQRKTVLRAAHWDADEVSENTVLYPGKGDSDIFDVGYGYLGRLEEMGQSEIDRFYW